MATHRQIEANRRNSRKSTGPTTEEGKDQSRRNALKHGLAGEGVVLPEAETRAVETRMAEWHSSLRPFDAYQTWLLEVIATESARVDRCRGHESALRNEAVLRAEASWDDDRTRQAEEVAATLPKNPGRTCARLKATAPGCRLLREWWRGLGRAIEAGGWDADQEALALDLLGVPKALRAGAASPLDARGEASAIDRRKAVVAEQVADLDRLLDEVLLSREDRDREAAAIGMGSDDGEAVARLRRYESACMRRLQWARAQLLNPGSHEAPRFASFASEFAHTAKPSSPAPEPAAPEPTVVESANLPNEPNSSGRPPRPRRERKPVGLPRAPIPRGPSLQDVIDRLPEKYRKAALSLRASARQDPENRPDSAPRNAGSGRPDDHPR